MKIQDNFLYKMKKFVWRWGWLLLIKRWGKVTWVGLVMFVEKQLMHQHIVIWFKQREYKERRKLKITLILDKDSKQWHVK